MKISKIKYQLLFLISFLLLGACSEEYLNPEPHTVYTEAEIWKTMENTYLYINGFYKPIYEYMALMV